jgi:hypothetical protein
LSFVAELPRVADLSFLLFDNNFLRLSIKKTDKTMKSTKSKTMQKMYKIIKFELVLLLALLLLSIKTDDASILLLNLLLFVFGKLDVIVVVCVDLEPVNL